MHHNSELLFRKYLGQLFDKSTSVLEIGAHIPSPFLAMVADMGFKVPEIWQYADIVSSRSERYAQSIDFWMDNPYEVPVAANSFDIVFSAQVLEHVRMPWIWFRELARVVSPGGMLITISPVSWPYHEAPVDCWRAHPEGMRALCEWAHVEPILIRAECLETTHVRPGMGRDHVKSRRPKTFRWDLAASFFGVEVEAAVDCVTVAVKPM